MNIFVTGTDTGVGKTVVTAGLAGVLQSLGFKVGVYKPVQAGCDYKQKGYLYSEDLDFVINVDHNIFTKCSYILKTPAAPVVSAPIDNENIDINILIRDYKTLSDQCDFVIVEGAGGISVPINPTHTYKDLITLLNIPTLIVARPHLGTINHSILTVEYARQFNIDLIGIIISGYPKGTTDIAIKTAPQIISTFTKLEILGLIPRIPGMTLENPQPELLIEAVLQNVNIEKVFRTQLPKLSQLLS
jgi:dethiobiotin synthetase